MSEQQPEADANTRLATASRLISNACAWSAGVGLIPLPIVDVAALAVVQVKLADDIARLYGQRFTRDALKGTVAVLLSTIVPTGVAGAVGGSLKFVPGIGTTVGVLSQPGSALRQPTHSVGCWFGTSSLAGRRCPSGPTQSTRT